MSVWKRLQRVGKSASKFQFTASYQELVVECTKKWQVTVLFIIGYVYCIQWLIRCLVIERPLSHLPSFWNLYACIFGHYWCYSLPFWFFLVIVMLFKSFCICEFWNVNILHPLRQPNKLCVVWTRRNRQKSSQVSCGCASVWKCNKHVLWTGTG